MKLIVGSLRRLDPTAMKSIWTCVFYVLVSVSMTFFNKMVLSHYKFSYSNVILFVQLIVTVIVLQIMKRFNFIEFEDVNMAKVKKLYIVSLFYAFNVGVALAALSQLKIPIYSSLKRMTLLIVLVGEWILLNKRSSLRIVVSVWLIVIGAVVMGYADVEFDVAGYVMATISCFSQACYLLFLAKTNIDTGVNTFELLFYNCLIALPFVAAFTLLTGEISAALAYPNLFHLDFLFCFAIAILLGALLNYSIFVCTTVNSPLTLVVVGQLKTVMTTFGGIFFFGGMHLQAFNMAGLFINSAGGFSYAWFKFKEKQKSSDENNTKKTDKAVP